MSSVSVFLRPCLTLRDTGFSYGTVLGMTIAALFPDKIGGMALDGNVNVYQYYRNSYVAQYLDIDKVFSLFCSTCIATPQSCALAHNQSSAELENDLLALFYTLKSHPLPVSFPDGLGGLADYTYITNQVNTALYEPTSWPGLSVLLAGLLAGNTTLVTEASLITTSNPGQDWLSGIRCGDNRVRVSEPSALNSDISAPEAESPIFGSDVVSFYYTCAQWPFYAKGNFSWPPGAVPILTASPVLLVGNLYDPVTPLANAKSKSADLEGSVVLQNGIGVSAWNALQDSANRATAYQRSLTGFALHCKSHTSVLVQWNFASAGHVVSGGCARILPRQWMGDGLERACERGRGDLLSMRRPLVMILLTDR